MVPLAPPEQARDRIIKFSLVLVKYQFDKLLFAGGLEARVPYKESFEGRTRGNHGVAVGYRLVIWSGSRWWTARACLNETGTTLGFLTHHFMIDIDCC